MCPHKGKNHRCCIEVRAGKTHARRAVAFLHNEEFSYVNVTEVYERLPEVISDTFKRRFENWIAALPGNAVPHHQYHGWDKTDFDGQYIECFVFKAQEHRLYGFLCRPKIPLDKQYELCVLVLHDDKHVHKTWEPNLKRSEKMRTNVEVIKAIEVEYPKRTQEKAQGGKKDKKRGKRK
jgi:hypothetical protein